MRYSPYSRYSFSLRTRKVSPGKSGANFLSKIERPIFPGKTPITLNTLLFQIFSRILLKLSPNGKKIAFTNFGNSCIIRSESVVGMRRQGGAVRFAVCSIRLKKKRAYSQKGMGFFCSAVSGALLERFSLRSLRRSGLPYEAGRRSWE